MQVSDKVGYEQLVTLARFLSQSEVDMRHLSVVKACYNTKEKQKKYRESLPMSVLNEAMQKIFAQFRKCDEIIEKMTAYFSRCVNEADKCEDPVVPFEKITILLDFILF